MLAGTETNVLPDGSVDYEDDLLAQLDWVVASVHTSFNMREENMTARVVAALEHPLVDALGPPDRAADRPPRAIRAGRGAGDRGGGAHRHLP